MATIRIEAHGLEQLAAKLKSMTPKGHLKAGILENATSQSVGRSSHLRSSKLLDYAPIQEFGGVITVTQNNHCYTIAIPPRPFLRSTFEEQRDTWLKKIKQCLNAGYKGTDVLELLGPEMVNDIVDKIKSNVPPPNSYATTKFKERYAPAVVGQTLQFTGTLINSIHYEVTADGRRH